MDDRKILVVTDSSASLPVKLVDEFDIRVIPLWLIWDDQCFLDGVDIDCHSFYRRLRDSKTLPTSTQPSAVEFRKFFEDMAGDCAGIVCVLASSKISGTVESAIAAQEFSPVPVEVVDSRFSAMGLGLIALSAGRAAATGASLGEVVETAKQTRERTHLLFVVDTLEYLHKGGRIGGAKKILGTALDIKPILHFDQGVIEPLSQTRTKKKAVKELLNLADKRLGGMPMAEAAIVQVDCLEDAELLREDVINLFDPAFVHISDVSPVVGTHVGPGGMGLAFYPESSRSS